MYYVDYQIKDPEINGAKENKKNLKVFNSLTDVNPSIVKSYRSLSYLIKNFNSFACNNDVNIEELGWRIKEYDNSSYQKTNPVYISSFFKRIDKDTYVQYKNNLKNNNFFHIEVPYIRAAEISDEGLFFKNYYWIKDRWFEKTEASKYLKSINLNITDIIKFEISYLDIEEKRKYFKNPSDYEGSWKKHNKKYFSILEACNSNNTILKLEKLDGCNYNLHFNINNEKEIVLNNCSYTEFEKQKAVV